MNSRKGSPKRSSGAQTRRPIDYRSTVNQANEILQSLHVHLTNLAHVPAFNSDIGNEPPTVVFDSLVKHRMVKKFSINDGSVECRNVAFSNYKSYEHTLPEPKALLNHVYWRKVKIKLASMLRGFTFDVETSRLQFTPGETYEPSQGEVSMIAKLHDASHWTTTWNCLGSTLDLIWHHSSLKSMARLHIDRHISSHERKRLWSVYSYVPEKDRPRYIFDLLLKTYVLIIVDGARASSVPKNTETDRFINVEAFFPILLQRIVAQSLLKCLKRHGNRLSNVPALREPGQTQSMSAQQLHGHLISYNHFSTVDFSNASDSVLVWVVGELFPSRVSEVLFQLRSHFVDFNGELFEPKKLSSMGNGFTFEVMTTLLYAMTSVLTPKSRVYGDDVIIPSEHVAYFVDKCAEIGFVPNMGKTFVNTKFRESCGYFYHDDFGYLTTFDFHKCVTFADVIVAHNKLKVTCAHAPKGSTLVQLLDTISTSLLSLVPASLKGPLPTVKRDQLKYMACYFYDDGNVLKKHKSNKLANERFVFHVNQCSEFFKAQQLCSKNFIVVEVPVFVPRLSKVKRHERAAFIASLFSGLRQKANVRGKGRWLNLPAFVDTDGVITLCRDARRHTKTALFYDSLDPIGYKHVGN